MDIEGAKTSVQTLKSTSKQKGNGKQARKHNGR